MCSLCRWACLRIFIHIRFRPFVNLGFPLPYTLGHQKWMITVGPKWMNSMASTSVVCARTVRGHACERLFGATLRLRASCRTKVCRDVQALMGRVRARERRAGFPRDGPAGRLRAEDAQHRAWAAEDRAGDQQRERARDRQRESRRRRQALRGGATVVGDDGSLSDTQDASEEGVNRRLVRRDVAGILHCVQRTLGRRRRPLSHKQAVMRTVWDSPVIRQLLPPEAHKVPSEVQAREGIVSSLLQSLSEVKTSKTRAQLVTKHAILTAAITNGTQASARQTARLLGVHHRNVTMAANRRANMVSSVHIQWTLSVRKTRSDATSPFVKDIVGDWWATQTRPSPNRKEVVRKWVAPKTYVQHHAQYLLESLVSSHSPFL